MQKYGICPIGAAAMRSQASHRSEMISQLIFGETFSLLAKSAGWLHIESSHDQYQGWVAANQVELISHDTYTWLRNDSVFYTTGRFSKVTNLHSSHSFMISGGSPFPGNGHKVCKFESFTFEHHGNLMKPSGNQAGDILHLAGDLMHTPYLWGGRSAFGVDCSGLVQLCFRMAGIRLPRDSSVQSNLGESIHLIHEAKAGDLAFFDNDEGVINHVGIITGDGHIIHAHGRVRKDKVDHQGIFNQGSGRYTHKLRLIKRICS